MMSANKFSKGELKVIAETDHVQCGDAAAMAQMLLSAMGNKPAAWKLEGGGAPASATLDESAAYADPLREVTPLYEHAKPVPTIPSELHPDTQKLVTDFCTALAEKLYKAQLKYGHSDDWSYANWEIECQTAFHEHIAKGDPRDVAAYCAFMWYHGWKTEPEQPASVATSPVNDVTAGKPLTITLPDIGSKAFWSGAGKAEVFLPRTYRCWVKEAIERNCAIARINVEVK